MFAEEANKLFQAFNVRKGSTLKDLFLDPSVIQNLFYPRDICRILQMYQKFLCSYNQRVKIRFISNSRRPSN